MFTKCKQTLESAQYELEIIFKVKKTFLEFSFANDLSGHPLGFHLQTMKNQSRHRICQTLGDLTNFAYLLSFLTVL